MDAAQESKFVSRILASGLLTREQLDAAWAALWPESETNKPEPAQHLADQRLAEKLVELGYLNRWQARELLAGQTRFRLGPYRILDSIGQGGMGQVFKAEHTIMGRIVAIKVLPKNKSTPEAVTGFMREIRAQAQLDHGNLVRALDAGHDGNVHYLVTEYVPGADLRKLVRRYGRLGMPMAASIIAQAAHGLEHAHEMGLIHRDVKPGNILVTPDGRAKVSDLGLVDFLEDDPAGDWQKGKIVGTADYLSPEQIKSPENVSPASDIYSLGCTLYYTVTGKVPFPGGTTRDKAHAHCTKAPLDPRVLNPDLSEEFVEVIAAMMEKDPAKRLRSTSQVIERLAPWIASERPVLAVSLTQSGFYPKPPIPPPIRAAGSEAQASLSDTQPSFGFGPMSPSHSDESSSQTSQATHPVASASDETLPVGGRDRGSKIRDLAVRTCELPRQWTRQLGFHPLVLTLLILGAAGAVACLLAIVVASL